MTVKNLRSLLSAFPDDCLIVRPGDDHSYEEADAQVATAMFYPRSYICEDHGDKHNDPGGIRKPVLLIT